MKTFSVFSVSGDAEIGFKAMRYPFDEDVRVVIPHSLGPIKIKTKVI
jgi:hypothetical protein